MLVHILGETQGSGVDAVNITDRTVSNESISGTCHAGIKLGSDGVLSTIQAGGSLSAVTGEWLVFGTPSTFYVQRTIISGILNTDPGPGFLQLNADRIYERVKSSAGFVSMSIFLQIADDAGGTNILDTATMVFECEQGNL